MTQSTHVGAMLVDAHPIAAAGRRELELKLIHEMVAYRMRKGGLGGTCLSGGDKPATSPRRMGLARARSDASSRKRGRGASQGRNVPNHERGPGGKGPGPFKDGRRFTFSAKCATVRGLCTERFVNVFTPGT